MRVFKLFLVLILTGTQLLLGQTGKEFWFAAPNASDQHYHNSTPLYLHITALYNTHVKISRPADPGFTPVEFDLVAGQSSQTQLDAILGINEIEVYERAFTNPDFIQNKGFLIESTPGDITAYYELSGQNNTDIVALKSNNALGTDFWVSTQRKYKNHGYTDDFSGFVVVATEDNTVVNVDPNGNNIYTNGSAPIAPIVLNAGETFCMRASGQAPGDHLFGVHVTSNKNITIIVYDDSMQIDDGGGNWDIFADQLIPIELIGKEYIVMKGHVRDVAGVDEDGEAIFITPTEDNTIVFIDGSPVDTLQFAGDYFEYVIQNLSTHVETSKPVYVNHITGWSTLADGARELGGAVLPSIDRCTGSKTVTVKRTPAVGFDFFNNLMVREDTVSGHPKAIDHFTYSINGGAEITIPSSHFTYIMGGRFAVYDRTKAGGAAYYLNVSDDQVLTVKNSIARFHLGVMQGKQSPGCKYGYFSDYAATDAAAGVGGTIEDRGRYCNLNPIKLVAAGGDTYQWFGESDPAIVDRLDYDTIAEPYFFPDVYGVYRFGVIITGECNAVDTLYPMVFVGQPVFADFSFSDDELCSPFNPVVTNLTNMDSLDPTALWTIYPAVGNSYQIDQDTIPTTYELVLPENTTDSAQVHQVDLVVKAFGTTCPTRRSKEITILPRIDAGFIKDISVDCHPLTVNFTDTSTGHIDTLNSFTWDFGDNTQSFQRNPTHNYINYEKTDTTYYIKLVVESPLSCSDSIIDSVTVYPRVRTAMAVNTSSSCSPLDITIDPGNSIGVDTFKWTITSPTILPGPMSDSTYITTLKAPIDLFHIDASLANPDTIFVDLVGKNRYGCVDTFERRSIIVFPEVEAEFSIANDTICDADTIQFINNSTGFDLFYNWDYDDGTIDQDTTGNPLTHQFFNRTTSTINRQVSLRATSGYNCEDTHDTIIVVHPYVEANFGIDYVNNCTPVDAELTNLSLQADSYEWDYGDGNTSTINDSISSHQFWNDFSDKDTTYYLQLVALNNEGCSDTAIRSVSVLPHVISKFSMNDNLGCSPFKVTFADSSSGGLSYLWNFGNGTTSTNPNPGMRTFTNFSPYDTTYYISLRIANAYGCDSITTDSVEVYSYIEADFNVARLDSCSPFNLQIENLSSVGANYWEWDLDGTVSNDFNPDFGPQTNIGTVTDSLWLHLTAAGANDPQHLACAAYDSALIMIHPELDVDFNVLQSLQQCQPFQSAINNTTNILTADGTFFQWFVDSVYYSALESLGNLTIQNLTETDEEHLVTLYGISRYGCTDEHSETITAYSLVDAAFVLDAAGICSGDTFNIDRRNTRGGAGITNYDWEFGLSKTSTTADEQFSESLTNATAVARTDTIRLTIQNAHACTDVATRTLQVYPAVTAEFAFVDDELCYPDIAEINHTSQNADFYIWDFDDGSGTSGTSLSVAPHLFENFSKVDDEVYSVKLIARSNYNCYDSVRHPITIFASPEAQFLFNVTAACPPFFADIENRSEGNDLTYAWDFNNTAQTSTDEEPTDFEVTNTGSSVRYLPLFLKVQSVRGCSDSLERDVIAYPNVVADFDLSTNIGCSPLNVDLISNSPNANNILWYIDGNIISTLESTSQRFENSTDNAIQTFEVALQARSVYGCADTASQTVSVYASPRVEFYPDNVVRAYNTEDDQTSFRFYNTTPYRSNWDYTWNFGDGNTGNNSSESFKHEYGSHFWGPNPNNDVNVTVMAWNRDNNACRDTFDYDIYIRPPLPQVELKENVDGCEPFTVSFIPTTKYIYNDSYDWDFDTQGGDVSSDSMPVFTFTKEGTYSVKLEVSGDGGTNFDTRKVTVHPKPIIDFTFNDSILFSESQNNPEEDVNFYNHTEHGDKYQWFFNVASRDTADFSFGVASGEYRAQSVEESPTWSYPDVGVYYTALIAESDMGCFDTLIHPISINVQSGGQLQFPTGFFVDPSGARDGYVNNPEDPSRNIFRAYGQGVEEFKLEIYNRWGVLVYETDDMNEGWNGFLDGKPAKQDVYIWRCKGRYTNGEPFMQSGDVTLILAPDPGQVH